MDELINWAIVVLWMIGMFACAFQQDSLAMVLWAFPAGASAGWAARKARDARRARTNTV